MPKAGSDIKWGIIGCGAVTEVKSGPAYQLQPGFSVHGVHRRNHALGEDYAARHGIAKFYPDAEALIQDPDIDAVYIATPPDSHLYYALLVAEAGKPCCIEKPLAPSLQECQHITRAFDTAGVPVFVAYYRRSLPRFLKVKELLHSAGLGQIRHVHWLLTKSPSDMDMSGAYNWRTDASIARGGYFDDLASHGLDLFSFLFGDFTEVSGRGCNQQKLYSAFDALTATWQHESGVTGSGVWNFGCDRRYDKVQVLTQNGMLEFAMFANDPIHLQVGTKSRQIMIDNPKHIQQHHVANIHRHLEQGIPHPSSAQTATHTAWAMEQILAWS